MKSAKATKRQVHRQFSRPSALRARQVRRAADFKLESLEERTLLSTTKVIPPPSFPLGLGAAYSALSRQAHGVGLNTGSPWQYTGSTSTTASPVTMADLTAYLKKLGASLPLTTGEDQVKSPNSSSVIGEDENPFEGEQDNPKDELFGRFAPNILTDPGNYLQLLARHPEITGITHPPLLPTVISGFDGMNFLDSVNGFVPPSADIAVGPDFVIETVNSQIQVYDKATGAALLPNTPLSTFFTQAGDEIPFDPVVTYDDIAGRFVVAALAFNPDFSESGNLLLAVSNDSNPFDGFSQANYQIDIGEGGFLPDLPKIGWNADEVVITSNMYTGAFVFDHVQVLSFAASSIFSATPPPTLTLGTDYFSADRFSGDFAMAAASMHGANPGDPMYFVEENTFADGSNLRVVSATDLLSGSPSFTDTVVPVSTYTLPPAAAQPGGTIATDDARILNAEYWNGHLVAGQNVGSPLDSDAHARWYEFDVTGSPTLVQDGTIAPAPGTSTYFPAVSIAPGGTIGMVYNESSENEFASVYVTGRGPDDPAGLMETPKLAKAGTATYADFAGAFWGDYNGIAVDPSAPGTFWGGAEYATADLAGMPANWATWISHFDIAPRVISSNPAPNSVVTGTKPTDFSLTFDEPMDPASITASDFTVNGTGADSASLSGDGLTITYTFNTSPVTQEGLQTMSLPAGTVMDTGGTGNVAFSANFFYVQVQLQVTATSPAVGSVVTAPFTDLVIQFNKPFDISSISTSDFQLSQGTVVSAVPLTPQAIDLTLSGVDHDGTLTLTIPAGAILDLAGVPNVAFTGSYIVDIVSTAYPTPLGPEPPAGSLIYDPSISGSVAFPGDTDSYTLPLAASQTLTLVLTVDPGLIGTLAVVDPDGNTVGSVTGASAGQTVVLQTVPVTTAGTYSLVVGGSGGTTGGYTLQAVLNAAYKQASDTNNSIASAYDLSGAFASLGTTPAADRAGVLGTIDPAADFDFYKFHLDAGQSATLAAAGRNDGQVSLALFDSAGNLLALGKDASLVGPLNFGGGFGGASSLLTLNGFANLSGTNLDLTDGGFSEAGSAFSKNALDVASFQTSFHFQVQPSSTSPLADGFTFTIQGNGSDALGFGGGDLGYGGIGQSVAIKFDYFDNAGEGTDSTGLYTNGQDPFVPAIDLSGTGVNISSGDVMNVAMSYDGSTLNVTITDTLTGASASQSYSVDIPSIVGGRAAYVGFTGGTGGLTSIPAILDWNYTPGQDLISTAKFESINNFVATTAGWYYAEVGGNPGTDYSMVATRGADFTLHGKSFDKAQPLDGVDVVLGAIVKGTGSLFTLDDQLYSAFNPIWATDPTTGAFIPPSIPQPGSPLNNPFGLNLAYDGTNLYFNSGPFFGTGELDKLDPDTGAVLLQTFPTNGINYGDIAYLDGKIYATNLFDGSIDIFDADTLTYESTILSVGGLVGLAGDPDRGVLWGVSQGFPGSLYEIEPATGDVLNNAPLSDAGYEQDLAYANGMLIVSDSVFFGSGGSYLGYYDPSSLTFLQRLPVATQGYVSGLGGDGLGGQGTDWYQFNVNAGDNLVLTTTTPGGTSANGLQFINDLMPTINLYDDSGNLVATATGNAGDGRNDIINWTALTSGSYRVQILGADKTTQGEYTISIQGATGPLSPFVVTSTDPAAGSHINFQPATMTVTFNDSVLLTSADPGDLQIDGQDATGVTVIDDHTLSFSLPALTDGVHSVTIAGLLDIQGTPLTPDTFTFTTDTVAPFVVSSSITEGEVLPVGDLTEVVTFSEPMDTSLTDQSSFDLFGILRNVHYAAASFSWDSTGTQLTINWDNLPSDAYTLTLFASGFADLAGNHLASDFVVDFSLQFGTGSFPTLKSVPPPGSLVYQGTSDQVLPSADAVDTFNLAIDPRQTLAVLVTPVSSDMTATVTLISPSGNVIGVATSPSPGAPALLPGVQSTNGGNYQIQVSGGPGEYKVQATLNALVNPASYGGPPHSSIATAQPIDPYANKFIGNADRTAVLGSIPDNGAIGPNDFGYQAISVDPSFIDITGTGTPVLQGTDDSTFFLDPGTLGGFTFNLYGQSYDSLYFSTNGLITFNAPWGDFTNQNLSSIPSMPAISPYWDDLETFDGGGAVYYQVQGSQLIIEWSNVEYFFTSGPITFEAVLNSADNTIQFNYGNLAGGVPNDNGASASVGIKNDNGASEGADPLLVSYNSGPNAFVNSFQSIKIGVNLVPVLPSVYSFHLDQGQSASVVLQSLSGQDEQYSLFDENGNLLALSSPGATNYTTGLNNFVARDDGTYYVSVTGKPTSRFNLVVTRNADFDTEKNNSIATAQSLSGTDAALGAITKGVPPLFTLDDNLYSPPFPIWATNPATGEFIPPSIPAPATEPNNPFGLNMAYDGTYLYYNDGANFGTNTIYKLDATTGAVIASGIPSDVPILTGLAYLNGELYGVAGFISNIYVIDPTTFALVTTIPTNVDNNNLTGIAGDPSRGVLWAVAQPFTTVGQIYEIDPSTGNVMAQAPDNSQGLNEQDIAYQGDELFVADTNGLESSGGTNVIDVYDANTLAFLRRMPVNVQGFVSGLAGDGLGSAADDTDYYAINVNAGDTLHITTSTPAGGPNEFVNNLFPELLLYDQNGNLVAVADGNASDGRNSLIDFTIPDGGGGTWYVQVAQSPNTPTPTVGEYGLQITGATGSLASFTVTSTIPADGALVQPPTDYIVTFSQPVYGPSLTPGELTVNGVPATAVTLVDAHTVDWTLDPAYIVPGNRVLNTVVISADPATGQRVEDISGAQLADFTSTFTTDTVPPEVIDSSVHEGDVFSPAPYDLTEVVTFSEPMDTTFTTAASFDLFGIYRNQHIAASAFSWSADGTQLTINYDNLPDDVYTLTLFASGFQDLVGHPLSPGDFTVDFAVALGTAAFPVPFKSIPPLGDLIYTGSDSHVLVTPTDVDNLTVNLDPGQTLTVIGKPNTAALQLVITVLDPGGNPVGTATASAPGQDAVLETAPVDAGGVYTIRISDANGNLGLYSVQAYLNAAVKSGTSNISIDTAQDISGSSYLLGPGNADRLGVVGSLPDNPLLTGQAFVSARYEIFFDGVAEILRVDDSGQVVQKIAVDDPLQSLSGVELSPFNNMLYAAMTTSFNSDSVSGELLEFDPNTGALVATITLPDDPANNFLFYPYGFAAAADGTFWVPQPNSNNIVHIDASGNLLASFSTGTTTPESASLRADGNVYYSGFDPSGNGIFLLDTSSGSTSLFASEPNPDMTKIAATGGVWVGDYFNGAQRFDDSGNLLQGVGYFGSIQAQTDSASSSANIWDSNFAFWELFRFDQLGNQQLATFAPGALGLTVWGVDNPNAPQPDTQDFYKFDLDAGQSATIVAKSLNGKAVQITLVDGSGNVLATGVGGSTNVDSDIENFIAPDKGTYYVEVSGDPGVRYSLTVTRSANFDIEPNDTFDTAQSLTGTNGALGAINPGGTLTFGQNIEGVDFLESNCGCLPPDTNAAVGPNHVGEAVNLQLRFWDKSGNVVFDEPLNTFFGALGGTFSDPYIEYDDLANRWYVESISASNSSNLLLAISNDSNPLDGFSNMYSIPNAATGALADFDKMGYNYDAIVLSANSFGNGQAQVTVVDKAQALAGNLVFYQSIPSFQFRAFVPAQMHGAKPGDPMWFMAAPDDGTDGNLLRVTEMTNILSNSPVYTDSFLTVNAYGPSTGAADQPGAPGSVATNDSTTTQVDFRDGKLVTAFTATDPSDNFATNRVHWYQVDVTGGTPALVQEGIINQGPGVATFFGAVAQDDQGNLGFSWMESSSTEFVSAWIGAKDAVSGAFSTFDAAPGLGFQNVSFRNGDYGSVAVDPSDGTTFWAANEYMGANGATDIWNTRISSFSLPPAVNNDWYTINVAAGNSLELQTFTPSDGPGEFVNSASLELELYDTFGNLVATGTKLPDGRNEAIFYNAPVGGQYHILVFNDPGGAGEYFLSVQTAQFPSGGVAGQVFNDLDGNGNLDPGDPGLANWEVDVFDSNGNFVAAQMTDPDGDFNIQGLAPGTYTVSEVVQAGWVQTAPPPPGSFTVTVTAGTTDSGLQFGNFQTITISGEKFNDLTGNGILDPGDPGLPGWTIDLLDATGAIIATTVTDANGDYSFTGIGPGTYTVQEELQSGWIQTFPAPPGTYTVTASSGSDQTGLLFGNFQLVTFAGTVYNDLAGNGVLDPGDPGLQGWTVNLLDSSGNLVATTTSAADGTYSFANVGPGLYTIEEVNQAGWYQTEPVNPPGTYTEQATSSSDVSGLDFGNFQLVNVSGEVYNDLNGNGNLDPGEPGLQGWTVNLLDASGNTVATTTSDANGDYEFDNLFPGTFTIEEILQSGWTQTQPVNPNFYTITTQSGMNETGLNFGNFSQAKLSGEVYNDLNGNGVKDSGEPGLSGWTVTLKDFAGNTVATTTSDSKGDYSFTIVQPGTYIIVETVQTGWVLTEPTSIVYTETVSNGTNLTGLDFGNFKTLSVSGNVYNDLDGNGLKNGGESGLASWTVNLEDSSGNILATVLSDSSGNYAITGVGPGSYQVAEVVQPNWVQTQPLYPTVYSFTVKSGQNLIALNFGDHASPALNPVQVIDNGQAGYSETGTWNTAVGGFNATNRVAQTSHGSGATATASWRFTGVASGSYDVYVTFASKSSYSKAAPFSVADGVTGLGTQFINESVLVTQSQGSRSQGSYGGVGWLELGTYTISSGTLNVVLANNASGNFVDADGVLIVAHAAPVTPHLPHVSIDDAAGAPIGTVDLTQPVSSPSTKKGSSDGTTTAPTVAISGVTHTSPVTVIYSQAPAQGNQTTSPSIVDLALSQNGNGTGTTQNENADVITSLALGLLSGKKVIA